jgi:hypothetical protein
MARKTTNRRSPRRRPNVPPPGGRTAAPARTGAASPRVPRGPSGPSSTISVSDEDLGTTYHHVAVDLRRILVLGVIMFALIAGAKMLSDVYGGSFVLDLLR